MQSGNVYGFIRPGKALLGLMVGITAIWLMFAVGVNWGGASDSVFFLLAGSTDAILRGEVWRLFTAPLLHAPRVWSLVVTLLGLLFLAPRLETEWGSARTLRFIALTATLSYVLQMLTGLVLPASIAARLVPSYWFGLSPAISAITIAWASTFRGSVVNVMGVLPMTSRTLVMVVVGFNLLSIAAGEQAPEGLLSPFFGMGLGWALGGGTPSPLRKAWLKLRLSRLESQANPRPGARRKPRSNPGGLRVIPGGRVDDDDKGPDGRWLN
jgi:membrane associated rhomboid family serine protease